MSFSTVHARGQSGIDAPPVTVETHLSHGLPAFNLVGLAETAVRESKERVRSAIINAGFDFPLKRITINLAPADMPKTGTRFDLAIALGILVSSGQVPKQVLARIECIAELALNGSLRGVGKILPAALASEKSANSVLVANSDIDEASLVSDLIVYSATDLASICRTALDEESLTSLKADTVAGTPGSEDSENAADLVDVDGQHKARRALEIAAAGGHHLLMIGSPGTGKTMLATRLPGLLPKMCKQEAFDSAKIWSVSKQGFDIDRWRHRPFRSPHHTCSQAALIGGGSTPSPGEVSLAHHGILFLDELPHFQKHTLEVLREPLENREVTISRAMAVNKFPANFHLVAAMNPCPCGNYGDRNADCICRPDQIEKYLQKISGPLIDRIDLQVNVPRTKPLYHRQESQTNESSSVVAARVTQAYARQLARQGVSNRFVSDAALKQRNVLPQPLIRFLDQAATQFKLSARGYFKILKVARTIADLADSDAIEKEHLAEAFGYRYLDDLLRQLHLTR
ncbi:MAG: YifB family Mg chelatase-like AAA ATPase [Pseudomonadota bacterium]